MQRPQQGLCLVQVVCLKTLGAPAVALGKHLPRLALLTYTYNDLVAFPEDNGTLGLWTLVFDPISAGYRNTQGRLGCLTTTSGELEKCVENSYPLLSVCVSPVATKRGASNAISFSWYGSLP